MISYIYFLLYKSCFTDNSNKLNLNSFHRYYDSPKYSGNIS